MTKNILPLICLKILLNIKNGQITPLREWKMKLNIAKSKVIHFGRKNLVTNFQI